MSNCVTSIGFYSDNRNENQIVKNCIISEDSLLQMLVKKALGSSVG